MDSPHTSSPDGLAAAEDDLQARWRRVVGRRSFLKERAPPVLGEILQPTHLLLMVLGVLLVLGPKRLPEAGCGLGQGLREFRATIRGREGDEP